MQNDRQGRGHLSSRVVFAGERWQSLDLCIHGQQLRWQCAECIEYFKEREKLKQKKEVNRTCGALL